jgi:hypothetical protein
MTRLFSEQVEYTHRGCTLSIYDRCTPSGDAVARSCDDAITFYPRKGFRTAGNYFNHIKGRNLASKIFRLSQKFSTTSLP